MTTLKNNGSWFNRHKIFTFILIWLFILIGLRLMGWGIGVACDVGFTGLVP